MQFFDKIKKFLNHRAEKKAKEEVVEFLAEVPIFGQVPHPCLKKHKERLAHKMDLTAAYTYKSDDDVLSKKQDFIDQYTINEQQQLHYFTVSIPSFCGYLPSVASCKAWRDHEQVERREAQKAWRIVQHRNHSEHMRQKFMNQKTR